MYKQWLQYLRDLRENLQLFIPLIDSFDYIFFTLRPCRTGPKSYRQNLIDVLIRFAVARVVLRMIRKPMADAQPFPGSSFR